MRRTRVNNVSTPKSGYISKFSRNMFGLRAAKKAAKAKTELDFGTEQLDRCQFFLPIFIIISIVISALPIF